MVSANIRRLSCSESGVIARVRFFCVQVGGGGVDQVREDVDAFTRKIIFFSMRENVNGGQRDFYTAKSAIRKQILAVIRNRKYELFHRKIDPGTLENIDITC